MKKRSFAALGVALVLAGVVPEFVSTSAAQRKDRQTAVRTLVGQVTDSSNQPLADSVVYLKNAKDLSVKTYISDQEGNYRFNALSSNADYEVYAEYKGRRSDVKSLSSFDSRSQVHINLRVR